MPVLVPLPQARTPLDFLSLKIKLVSVVIVVIVTSIIFCEDSILPVCGIW